MLRQRFEPGYGGSWYTVNETRYATVPGTPVK